MTRRLTKPDRELWDRLKPDGEAASQRQPGCEVRRTNADCPAAKAPKPASARKGAETAPAVAFHAAPNRKRLPRRRSRRFEEKTLRRLGRALVEVDAKIDLHGMRQERADAALAAFLRHAQARGDRIVLVVTGKGKRGAGEAAACCVRWCRDGLPGRICASSSSASRKLAAGMAARARSMSASGGGERRVFAPLRADGDSGRHPRRNSPT